MVRESDARSFWLRLVYVALQSLLPLLNLYLLKLLVDAVSAGATASLRPAPLLAGMVCVFLLNRIVSALSAVNNDVLSQRLIDHMGDEMQGQAARLDMAYYDTPAYHDTMHRAQQEAAYRPLQIMNNFMALFGSLLSIVGVVAMLAAASWWVIVAMLIAVAPAFAVRLYKARSIYRFRRQSTQLYRQTSYYGALLSARDYAKEMRAFNLTAFFRSRYCDSRRRLVRQLLRISRRMGVLDVLCSLVEAAAMFLVVWLLIRQALAAAISIGTFVMLFEAFRRGQSYLTALVSSIAALYDNRLFVGNLFDFLDLKPSILSPDDPLPMPSRIETVELRDVTFRYPDMDRDVLSHFNLEARVGEPVVIRGENGFGKTTVLKLILRLYDPQQGTVLVNGIDIRRFSLADLRGSMGVLFQDFVRYNLTAAENIAFDRPFHRDWPLADSLGIDEILHRLPHGYNSQLGRLFDGGTELSMGQWQRMATARALHTDAPILLLDEPAAWLDHRSRQLLDKTIDEIKDNKIIIIVSHA